MAKHTPGPLYRDMSSEERLRWGEEESAARKRDLSVRTPEGLARAKINAEARRMLIGASASAASEMVADFHRQQRLNAIWSAMRGGAK